MAGEALLEVDRLVTEFPSERGAVRAVDGVSFEVASGRTLGVVGESGSGKSVTALSILGLVPAPGRVTGGAVRHRGRDLLTLGARELRRVRGDQISMIFQEPMTSLNPVLTAGEQVVEAVRLHRKIGRAAAREVAVDMLGRVGIPAPADRMRSYPHQLSGGMRQRVMIAMALVCRPELLVADEPTTALDVTVQAQILDLLRALQRELGMGVLLITHDLGVVAESCEDVVVMYAGRVVERARTADLFAAPRHPYTAGLLRSMPRLPVGDAAPRARLQEIPGAVPSLHALPAGCKFQDRCPSVQDRCRAEEPALAPLGPGLVRCHFPVEAPAGYPTAAERSGSSGAPAGRAPS
jgi:peptide/nickel transport system ATP-binding protein